MEASRETAYTIIYLIYSSTRISDAQFPPPSIMLDRLYQMSFFTTSLVLLPPH